jgi:hypothetical protein
LGSSQPISNLRRAASQLAQLLDLGQAGATVLQLRQGGVDCLQIEKACLLGGGGLQWSSRWRLGE